MKTLTSKQTHFDVVEFAGEGLNSRVYKAFRRDITASIKQLVALKILKSKDDVSVWRQEAHSLLQVKSPYCVQVFDFVWVDQQPALVLEWLDGVTLTELFRTTLLTREEAEEILLQTQEGLIDLHLAGLCHGDLHMGNIFITRDGQVKLIDFGWANVSRAHEQGAPELRAPELERGASSDFWADLFSLGRIAAQMEVLVSSLLEPDPRARDLMSGQKSPLIQSQIAGKVRTLIHKNEVSKGQATQVIEKTAETKTPPYIMSLCLLIFGMFLTHSSLVPSSFAASVSGSAPCVVEVRTRHWHEIQIHGRSHYSPARLELSSCDKVRVDWKGQAGSGTLHLQLAPGTTKRLTDGDFTLDRVPSH